MAGREVASGDKRTNGRGRESTTQPVVAVFAGDADRKRWVGAAAEAGALAALKALGACRNQTAHAPMGVAQLPCTVPAAGRPDFSWRRRNGNGRRLNGEPGRAGYRWLPADEIAEELVGAILKDLRRSRDSEVLLFVNGFGDNAP